MVAVGDQTAPCCRAVADLGLGVGGFGRRFSRAGRLLRGRLLRRPAVIECKWVRLRVGHAERKQNRKDERESGTPHRVGNCLSPLGCRQEQLRWQATSSGYPTRTCHLPSNPEAELLPMAGVLFGKPCVP